MNFYHIIDLPLFDTPFLAAQGTQVSETMGAVVIEFVTEIAPVFRKRPEKVHNLWV